MTNRYLRVTAILFTLEPDGFYFPGIAVMPWSDESRATIFDFDGNIVNPVSWKFAHRAASVDFEEDGITY